MFISNCALFGGKKKVARLLEFSTNISFNFCRYFIVVDDIWSIEAWKLVKSALPENGLKSRIITTTRNSKVATSCCTGLAGYVYNIQPLSDQQSQQLFFKRVFGNNSSCPPHLEQVSFGILKKCNGLTLAIITIGCLLVAGKSN
jgi:hypothetical protein